MWHDDVKRKVLESIEVLENSTSTVSEMLLFEKKKELGLGLNSSGNRISPSYSPNYAKKKARMPNYGAPFGTPNLKDSGDYQDSFVANQKGYVWDFALQNAPSYAKYVTARYGEPNSITDKSKSIITKEVYTIGLDGLKKIWK